MDKTDLQKLTDERVKLIKDAQSLLDKGTLSPEEDVKFNAMMADADKIKVRIDQHLKVNEAVKDVDSFQAKIHTMNIDSKSKDASFRASEDYKRTFMDVIRSNPQELAHIDYRNVLQTTPGSQGGFLVPTEMNDAIIMKLTRANFMRGLATTITTANDRDIPVELTNGAASWVAQSAAIGAVDDTFAQKILKAYKLTKLVICSTELLEDSAFDLPSYLAASAGKAFATAEEQAMMVGNGTTQPRGITLDGTAFNLGGNVITAPLLMDIYSTLVQEYLNSSSVSWIMNPTTLAAIRKLTDVSGAFYFVPSMVVGAPDTILGKPVNVSSFMPALGAGNKSIVFGDISYYWIGDRAGRTMQRLNELYAGNGQVGFLARERVDALLTLDEAVVVAASP